ncbi:hypothetical protein HYFRA_00000048 [Hymenoscyphus fraxineus]|uniref:enoyl-[acyl-carrier-protein] reductase n=1 Tax=Hymenoscyphus fraxineus TaxID=746836 RepID=A0A9N9PWF3_9HELO|nr:hypothetical protein HYFRA_00000048 [Hymenoscyphus fraxineus]
MSLPRALRANPQALPRALRPQCLPVVAKRWKSGPYGYTQAKALVYSQYGEPSDVLSLHKHSISPSLPPSTILLRTLAAPINPADINQIQGLYPSRPPLTSLLGTPTPSAVAGNEGCFEVTQLGPGIKTLQKGDWVIMKKPCFGTWRTHALASENDVLKIENKDGLSVIQVGTVGINPVTAWWMLKGFVDLEAGRDWFIQNGGNSGVGRAAVQLGREWGLKSVSIVRSRPTAEETEGLKKELMELGATKVITEEELQSREGAAQIKDWTDGNLKLGLNCVGGKPALALTKTLSPAGHLVTYGAMSKQPLSLPASLLIFKDLRFSGFWVSRYAEGKDAEKKEIVDSILELTRQGKFKDIPVQEMRWEWETEGEKLKEAVSGTLEGFRSGKGVLVFGDT